MTTPGPDRTTQDACIPDLLDPNVRSRLAGALPAVIRMMEAWGLTRADQAGLLTLSPRTIQRAAQGKRPSPLRLTQDQLMRMSLITGIYAALHAVYDGLTADTWMTRANGRPPFDGRAPVRVLLQGGIPSLLMVRRMLDADRSGQFGASPHARLTAHSLPQPDINLPES